MPLPPFNEGGDLPVGIHAATLCEILERFGKLSAKRKVLALRLQRIYQFAFETGHLSRIVIFGSFVTTKQEPNDVDLFLLMGDNFNVGQLAGEARILFDHPAAQNHFGCSVFWLRHLAALNGEQATLEHWQIRRDGTQRGIVEIVSEEP